VIGDIAQDFTLKDQNGNLFSLYNSLNSKILLIFYPKDNTPVCTRQLTDYQINKRVFDNLGINLIGINTGSVESHNSFTKSCYLDFPVLSDPSKEVSSKYKALNFFGGNKRKLVLIGIDKKILFEKDVLSFTYLSSGKLKEIFKRIS
jgi:thioredoxin-dependent peroxiredoxin